MKISRRLMLGATLLTAVSVIGSAGTTGWLALNDSSHAFEGALEFSRRRGEPVASTVDGHYSR